MNTFIYPISDTYITSDANNNYLNFGIDEILKISSKNNGVVIESKQPSSWKLIKTELDYGQPGWVSIDDTNVYSYECCNGVCKWRSTNKLTGTLDIDCPFRFLHFDGNFFVNSNYYNNIVDVKHSYFSGSAESISGYFTGSFNFSETVTLDGSISSAVFNGRLHSGSTFDEIYINGEQYTGESPLTEDLVGCGWIKGFNGVSYISGATLTQSVCSEAGLFSGNISGLYFNGSFKTENETQYDIHVTNSNLYFYGGEYSGVFNVSDDMIPSEKIKSPSLSRTLLKFDLQNIFNVIKSNTDNDEGYFNESNFPEFTLKLTTCNEENIPFNYKIYAYPISQSWDCGNGRYAYGGSELGVSWLYRDFKNGTPWYTFDDYMQSHENVDYLTNEDNAEYTFKNGGGTWYYKDPVTNDSLICSQNFDRYSSGDVSIDITNIVKSWYFKNIENNGIILLTSREIVDYPTSYPENKKLEFFSKDTNTIYTPCIQISWDDSIINTGSLIPANNIYKPHVILRNLQQTYKSGEYVRISVFSRNNNQIKQFNKDTQQPYMITPNYLPVKSYYMIKDAESEMVLVDFSKYTKLSCDPKHGNYFNLDTTGFPQERYYNIIIKSEFDTGEIVIFDTNQVFKIIR